MKTAVIGFPRIGKHRELKFAVENFLNGIISREELVQVQRELKCKHWNEQVSAGIDYVSSNDFTLYDQMLDTSRMLNVIPKRYRELELDLLDEYFAMARGYQDQGRDVKALAMKKWFNTNYHYMVPEIEVDTQIQLVNTEFIKNYQEAKNYGVLTKPVLIGPFTFMKLSKIDPRKSTNIVVEEMITSYQAILFEAQKADIEWIQLDEPALVMDLNKQDIELFLQLYTHILKAKGCTKVLLQTYFGDIRDCYHDVMKLSIDAIGLDFVEGTKTLELIRNDSFKEDLILFAGVVNGKNIWKNNYQKTIEILSELVELRNPVVLSTSCSLLHVPYTTENEDLTTKDKLAHFSFAKEKLKELVDLKNILTANNMKDHQGFLENVAFFSKIRQEENVSVKNRIAELVEHDFIRRPSFIEREKIQKNFFELPILPTTTIGSFPQTKEIKQNRYQYKKAERSFEEYDAFMKFKIVEWIAFQEEIGLDVLVHGEFERNDMVEYFGENLDGFLFTQNAWVQSYGTRCVKPPIIWGDVQRIKPLTLEHTLYAKDLTKRPVKGMLTGPVTILNWSFPREDLSLKETALQIALAIKEEVLELEKNDIKIIQIDEAALREKLPIRKQDWNSQYLDWAIKAFRLVHSSVEANTQIHTHMCYSEFADIIQEIDDMDADVITFEAARSNLELLEVLKQTHFKTQVGPGIYDIHSPRIPDVQELEDVIHKICEKIPLDKIWINPDCGLKTRGEQEAKESLRNMVIATKKVRDKADVRK